MLPAICSLDIYSASECLNRTHLAGTTLWQHVIATAQLTDRFMVTVKGHIRTIRTYCDKCTFNKDSVRQ